MGFYEGMELPTGGIVIKVLLGGFAQVAVVDDTFGGLIVVKVLRDEVLDKADPAVLEAFYRECWIWAHHLTKPPEPSRHIARALFAIRDLAGLGPAVYVTYVDGPALGTLIRGGRQTLSQSVLMGGQIAAGLACAHERDVRHRDLKPSNILLTSTNEIRLIDWGLSKAQHRTDATAGLLDYWSPDRRADPSLDDEKDDIYALGVLLFECLTGRFPRDGVNARADLAAVQPVAPDEVLDLVDRMLAPKPHDRPNAAAVAAAFGDVQLREDLLAREIELPFCRSCGYTAVATIVTCPVCHREMYERYAQPPREGMVRVPPGVFVHGLTEDQARRAVMAAGIPAESQHIRVLCSPDDPPCSVFVPGFDIDLAPVTNAEYAQFVVATNYPAPADFEPETKSDHPVVNVGWRDALCYALWADKRLARPLEWEKAARGDKDNRTYPWGDTWQEGRCSPSRTAHYASTSPIGTFTAGESDGRSPFGVTDMPGNVSEWVSHSRKTLGRGRDPEFRAVCGGGWTDPVAVNGAVSMQVSAEIDYRGRSIGFRCAADIVYAERPVVRVTTTE
jgi:formylglycine-generating enzyme required for sulfatase activity